MNPDRQLRCSNRGAVSIEATMLFFFFSSRRRHTRFDCDWSSDVCSSDLKGCPVAKTNPYSQMTAEERLRFALWLQEAEKQNTKVLKDLMVERGLICYREDRKSVV